MKCPYCNSNDTVEYGYEADVVYNFTVIIYRCYNCGQDFEERNIKGCGKQIFKYGDNYPVFNKGEDKMKFDVGNKVRVRVDVGIYYEGVILYCDYLQNLYKVNYFDGYKYIEDIFKGEELEKIPILSKNQNYIPTKEKFPEFKEHQKFRNMGKVPKAKKDDLINLWIDLWYFLKDKVNGIKEKKK